MARNPTLISPPICPWCDERREVTGDRRQAAGVPAVRAGGAAGGVGPARRVSTRDARGQSSEGCDIRDFLPMCPESSEDRCTVCYGWGWIYLAPEGVGCDVCRGTGRRESEAVERIVMDRETVLVALVVGRREMTRAAFGSLAIMKVDNLIGLRQRMHRQPS